MHISGFRYIRLIITLFVFIMGVAQVQAAPAERPMLNVAPTYRVFATREGLVGQVTANGHTIQPRDHFVALPSWRVLSSYHGYEYQVRITYNGRSTIAPVWDVGPWNTNDSYWSPDRGSYPDLPIGMPQAQAAFYDGHNGGLDEFGRRINNPNGIDIADGTFWDALGMTRNDWVDVSFLWLGADPGPGAAVQAPIPAPPPANVPAPPAQPEQPPANAPAPAPAPDPAQPEPEQPIDTPMVQVGAIAVDNDDPEYDSGLAVWEDSRCGLNGSHAWTPSSPTSENRAWWQPDLEIGGYEVSVYVPACGDAPATRSAHYVVAHDRGETEVVVDQAAAAGTWVSLGTFYSGRKSSPTVQLSGVTDDEGQAVRFDAVAWMPSSDTNPPQSRMLKIMRERNGYRIEWGGVDDLSGIAAYDVQVRQLPRGGWRTWVQDLELTNAWFGPDEGKHFAFRVRARDWAGNEQPWPETEGIMDTHQAEPEPEEGQ